MTSRTQDPLAMKLLDGEVMPGESLVVDGDPKCGEMTFARATAKAARLSGGDP